MGKTAPKQPRNSHILIKETASKQAFDIRIFIAIFVALGTFGTMPSEVAHYSDVYREAIAETGFIGLLLYWIIRNRHAQTITLTLSAPRLWLGGLLLLATVSVFWAVDIDFFINKYLLWLASAAVFLLTLGLSANTKTHISISRAIVFVGVYISTIGLLQVFFSITLFDQVAAPAANMGNKNVAAQIIVLIFPLTAFLLLVDKNKHLSLLYSFAITLMLAYIFHTLTRGAWVSMSIQIILLAIAVVAYKNKIKQAILKKTLHWNREKTISAIGAFILLLLLCNLSADGWVPAWEAIARESSSIVSTAQDSSSHRYGIWSVTLSMLGQNPLIGSGMGSFYYNGLTETGSLADNIHGAIRAHNDLLELGVELGIIGVILFLGVVVSLLINLLKLIRQEDTQQQVFYWAVGTALAGSFVNMQFSFPYQMSVPVMIFGMYSALIIKAGDAVSPAIKTITVSMHSEKEPGRWSKKWFAGIAFVGIILLGTVTMNTLWLSSLAQIDDNIKHNRWLDPITEVSACSKTATFLLMEIVLRYNSHNMHAFSKSVLDSFNRCVPDTWFYYSSMSSTLIGLGLQYKAIETLKTAITMHPKGEYRDYRYLYTAYYNVNNRPAAHALYQALRTQPEELLAIMPLTLGILVAMSVDAGNLQQATKFYHLYIKHHGENAQIKEIYMRLTK